MAREFQRSLEQAANEAGMSEMQKSLRSLDQSLNSATDSARKFARQPMRAVVEETVLKPASDAGARGGACRRARGGARPAAGGRRGAAAGR